MSLSLLHPWIAALAAAAVAVPVIIHLLLRQQPKPVVFPAMVLLRRRHQQTIRRLRVRHWLLLALRCLVLLLLGLALARPTIRSESFSLNQEAPIGAVFVFDDSPSMEFKERGQTRLERAQELAAAAIHRMPEGSQITVLEASNPAPSAPLDRAAAVDRIERIQIQWTSRPVNDATAAAIRAAAQLPQERREVYVLSDQAASAWNLADAPVLGRLFAEVDPPLSLYLLDVHAEKLNNTSLDEATLSTEVATANAELTVEAAVRNRGAAVDNAVRLTIDGEPRGEKALRLGDGQSASVSFPLAGLSPGFHQGEIALAATDAMPFDDRRYFTVEVRPPVRVLVIADDAREALYWTKALAPDAEVREQRSRYEIDVIRPNLIEQKDLDGYAAIAMIHAASASQGAWLRLAEYVHRGGGLFVSLGPRVDSANYNSVAAQQVLPAALKEASSGNVALVGEQSTHPVLAPFQRFGSSDLGDWAVLSYWKVEPGPGGAVVVLPYTNGDPGLIERTFGDASRGKSMLLTTAAHYEPGGAPWSELALGWSFVVLADEVMRYLAGAAETQWNFRTGEAVAIPRKPGEGFGVYAIADPTGNIERISIDPRSTEISVPALQTPGHYRVEASNADQAYSAAFSANVAPMESSIEPIAPERLREIFGDKRVAVARDPSELQRVEGASRVGRELFGWLMVLFAAVVCLEGFLSNRFYRERPRAAK